MVLTTSGPLTPASHISRVALWEVLPPPTCHISGTGMQEPGVWAGFVWWLWEGRMGTGRRARSGEVCWLEKVRRQVIPVTGWLGPFSSTPPTVV